MTDRAFITTYCSMSKLKEDEYLKSKHFTGYLLSNDGIECKILEGKDLTEIDKDTWWYEGVILSDDQKVSVKIEHHGPSYEIKCYELQLLKELTCINLPCCALEAPGKHRATFPYTEVQFCRVYDLIKTHDQDKFKEPVVCAEFPIKLITKMTQHKSEEE